MHLSPLDDYPVHQVPAPVRYVGTSDRNFYDRYYFNIQDPDGRELMLMGLGVYPNLGVMDAFAGIRVGDEYRVVRSSKHLGNDPSDTTVGPMRIQVLEGLRSLRVVLEPNEWGLTFDLLWTAATAAHFESPRFRRDRIGRVSHDHCRFNQVGTWAGHLDIDGVRRIVTASWVGVRDRSWGIRPVGEPEPERLDWPDIGGQPRANQFWNYSGFLFPDYSITYICEEDGDGVRTMQDAVLTPRDGGPAVPLGRPRHDLEFVPGTRRLLRGRIHMTDPSGAPVVLEMEPRTWVPILLGSGYRPYDHWRHGKDQGPLAVEGVRYDLNDPALAPLLRGDKVIDAAVHCRVGDVAGIGTFEMGLTGRNDAYGFTDAESMAP